MAPCTTRPPAEEKHPLLRYIERLEAREGEEAVERLAKAAGTSVRYLRRVARRDGSCGARLQVGIVRATGGRITYRQLAEYSPGLDTASRAGQSTILMAREARAKRAAARKRREAA